MKVTIEARDWEDAIAQVKYFAGTHRSPPPVREALGDPAMRDLKEQLEDLEPAPSYDDVYAAVKAVLVGKGEQAATKLLAPYGVTSAKLVPVEKRRELIAAAKELLSS